MSIKNLLIEMKNMSELMVDLAYSAVLFNSVDAAEEVLTLENRVNAMNYEIKKESLVAARSYEDAEKLTALLEIAEAAESMANAAKDLADLVIKGIKPHPVFKMVMEESDKMIARICVVNESDLANKTLGEFDLDDYINEEHKSISIFQLLSHTSGLESFGRKIIYEKGTYHYSNYGLEDLIYKTRGFATI